ncbi:MAG: substrate-binding domain-containing protein [Chloroflexi bacterium]|uniref:substrate-binding domain-containing protein n=1 Tax=Candidatus Flexifilum breve TaxID=3140694 RepID=UPI0031376388|nr:substrate-binding domain-containing protein [Chloroflexota bacterium]
MFRNSFRLFLSILLVLALSSALIMPAAAQDDGKWCTGQTIRFFVGGAEGDAFGSIVLRGAQAAEADLGATVEYVFSGWDVERMIQQLREAIAAEPDGIAMMGHPGNEAIMPLAEEAAAAGISMMYQNVDVPDVRARFGGGYIGAQLVSQGRALGEEVVRQYGLGAGDTALVFVPLGQPGRDLREGSTADALEAAGVTVVRLDSPPEYASDPNLALPALTAAALNAENLRLIVYPGGQLLGAVPVYMDALGFAPGDIVNIGFDTSPAIMEAFQSGYVQLTSDQQPFLQGYLPILSLCGTLTYGFGALNVDTGAGFVDTTNYASVAEQAIAGYR